MANSEFSRLSLPDLITMVRSDLYARLSEEPELLALRRNDPEIYSRVIAGATHLMLGYLDNMAKNLLPDLAKDEWLIRHGNLKKCFRKPASAAQGFIRWDNVADNIKVLAGQKIKRQSDQLLYTVQKETVSSHNLLKVPVVCDEKGVKGNTTDGSAFSLISPITGLPLIGYADTLRDGHDIEDLESFRSRVIERWHYTPQSGADHDYEIWAKEIAGITRAWCYRHWMGAGTIGIMVANSDTDNPSPSQTLIEQVKAHLDKLSPVAGSQLYVFAPQLKKVDFTIELNPDTPQTRYQVEMELRAFLLREGGPNSTIYLSRISEVISSAFGEYKHKLILPKDDIKLANSEVAVIGAISWI